MAKKQRSGRVTPKGTRAPEHEAKQAPTALPPAAKPFDRGAGKVGKGSGRVSRPISHNRGNR